MDTITLSTEQWAAISLIRSAYGMDSATTQAKCRKYADALGVPKHIQIQAMQGKSDAKIRADVAQYNSNVSRLLAK